MHEKNKKRQNMPKTLDDAEMMYLYWNDPATVEILNLEQSYQPVPQPTPYVELKSKIPHPIQEKIQRNIACQGSKLWLECNLHDLLDITDSLWGALNTTNCQDVHLSGSLVEPETKAYPCQQERSITLNKVKEQCQGEMRCELTPDENIFDHLDCPKKLKRFLEVDYRCLKSESRIKDTGNQFGIK